MNSLLIKAVAVIGLASCQSLRQPINRDHATSTTGALTLQVTDIGQGICRCKLSNSGVPVSFTEWPVRMPRSTVAIKDASGKNVSFTREGQLRIDSPPLWSTALITLEKGESYSWDIDLRRFFRVNRGTYYLDLSVPLNVALHVERGGQGVTVQITDLMVKLGSAHPSGLTSRHGSSVGRR